MAERINDLNSHYTGRVGQWMRIREVIDGEDAIKEGGERYLPKPSGLTPTDYTAYKSRAYFFPAAERALRGMVGLAMRKDPSIEVPDKMWPMIEATTSDATPFMVLLDEMLREVMSIGRYGMLLDFPPQAGPNDLPYITTYMAEDILNWKQDVVNGRKTLVRLLLKKEDESDETTNTETKRFIEAVLENGTTYVVNRYKEVDGEKTLVESLTPKIRGATLGYIPFAFVNPYDNRPTVEKPPFLDLVNVNLAHYRNSADYEHALFYTAQPTPWYAGTVEPGKAPRGIGPSNLWALGEGGQAGMLEFSGAGIAAQRTAMGDKEANMAALGARMITDSVVRNESTDTAKMRGSSETSLMLSSIAMCENALNTIFRWAGDWVGVASDQIEINLNRDLYDTKMSPQDLKELVAAWMSGAISRTTLHENLQRGEIVDGSRTVEEEVDEILADEVNMPAPPPTSPQQPTDELSDEANEEIADRIAPDPEDMEGDT